MAFLGLEEELRVSMASVAGTAHFFLEDNG